MKIASSLSLVLGFGSLTSALLAAPVNSNATPEAQKLLAFLTEIEGHYTLTAQHNFASSGSKYTREVEAITGKSPLIWGSDFSFAYDGPTPEKFQHCGPLNLTNPGEPLYYLQASPQIVRKNMIATAIKEAKSGHIITLMWHAAPPGTPDGATVSGDQIWTLARRPNQTWWDELTTDGSTLNTSWKKQADEIAGYLGELQDAHVPVLWRPFHEMNGVWFWWGAKSGDQGFKKLWVMMYNYFVHEKRLNNLVWVWDTNAPRAIPGDEAGPYTEYWPGSDYVDVLAADIYRKDWKQSHHDDLLKLAAGKPIAMGEVGEPPSPELLNQQSHWDWFMPWPFGATRGENPAKMRQLFADKRVLTTTEVTLDANGDYHIKTQ